MANMNTLRPLLDAPEPRVQLTLLGGHFNSEQSCVPLPQAGQRLTKRAELVRREHRADPSALVTFADDVYVLSEVAPGWWIGLHELIHRGRGDLA